MWRTASTQLEHATRNATVDDDFLGEKGRDGGPKLSAIFGQAGGKIPVHIAIDVGLPQRRIDLPGSGAGD